MSKTEEMQKLENYLEEIREDILEHRAYLKEYQLTGELDANSIKAHCFLRSDLDTFFKRYSMDGEIVQSANKLLNVKYPDLVWIKDMQIYLHELQNHCELTNNVQDRSVNKKMEMINSKKVFSVHGHDDAAKEAVARTLEKAGLEAIILHEQVNGGKTIIEKLETCTDVGYAVVLYTPCDKGHAKNDPEERSRARQNVVFEHGYLIAKLGRDRVCALVKENVERPSDLSGIVYIPMDDGISWKMMLAKEMNSIGFKIDANQLV